MALKTRKNLTPSVKTMTILGIETSCDETSAAIIEGEDKKVILKSNVTATSLSIHAKTGGVIPENAAREQIKYILPVINNALADAKIGFPDLDAVAVTFGPGLIGSLLVGVETAKTISYVFDKPIIPVNHMVGHIYANFITHIQNTKYEILNTKPEFPAIALVVSGGHTDLLLLTNHNKYKLLGGTRDDAAGEAFDKIGRLLGLPYPAGPAMELAAKKGDPKGFRFPRPLIGSADYDFSFSGLKTAVLREVQNLSYSSSEQGESRSKFSTSSNNTKLDEQTINDLAFATQDAIVDVLVRKTMKAAEQYNVNSIIVSGGVAANQSLRNQFEIQAIKLKMQFFAPPKNLCTDNAAMIASAGYFNYDPTLWKDVTANPELYFEQQ